MPTIRKDIRDVEPRDLDGFDAVIHLAGLSNDPLGDLNPRADLRDQSRGDGAAGRARQARRRPARFLFSSTCSIYGAAGDDMLDESSRVQPGHALRRLQGARRSTTCGALADRQLLPGLPARRDRLRRVAAAALRSRGQQPGRLGGDHRQVFLKSDGTPWRPLVHIEDIARAFVALLQAPAERSTTGPSTSAGPTRTTGSATSPRSSPRSCRSRGRVRRRRLAGPAQLPRQLRPASRATLPEFRPHWTVRRRASRRSTSLSGDRAAAATIRGPALQADRLSASSCWPRAASTTSCAGGDCADAAADLTARERRMAIYRTRAPPAAPAAAPICSRILGFGATPLADRLLTADQLGRAGLAVPLTLGFCPQLQPGADRRDGRARGPVRRRLPLFLLGLRARCSSHSRAQCRWS